MDGVTILSQTTETELVPNMIAFWVAFSIVMIIGIAVTILVCCLKKDAVYIALFFMFFVVSVIIGMLVGDSLGEEKDVGISYKVTVDDSVSLTEFYEEYEVIETEGKILTVREKKAK